MNQLELNILPAGCFRTKSKGNVKALTTFLNKIKDVENYREEDVMAG